MNNLPLTIGLRAFSRLLDYPDQETRMANAEIASAVAAMPLPETAPRKALEGWVEQRRSTPLLDLQEEYVAQFDRGRAVSLLLFEHVHGESRDRGQAMVDLLAAYNAAGFELDRRELPDYLPTLLEFLSTQNDTVIGRWLGDVSPLIALVAARLYERQSDYALILHTLLCLIGEDGQLAAHGVQASQEQDDRTPEALDAAWQEAAVSFSSDAGQDCTVQAEQRLRQSESRQRVAEEAVHWVDAQESGDSGRKK